MEPKTARSRHRRHSDHVLQTSHHRDDRRHTNVENSGSKSNVREHRRTSDSITVTDDVACASKSDLTENYPQTSCPTGSIDATCDDSRTVADTGTNTCKVHSPHSKMTAVCSDSTQSIGDLPGGSVINTGVAESDSSSANDISRTMAINDNNMPEVQSPAIKMTADCHDKDDLAQTVNNLTGVSSDNSGFAESVDSSVNTSKYFGFTDSNLLGDSADVVTAESKWQNFVGDRASDGVSVDRSSPHHHQLVHTNSGRSQTVNESMSPVRESVSVANTKKSADSEAAVKRKRRISAARSALYRRLLSSETAASSDAELGSDIFDVQSLSSSSDDDDAASDVSDLHLDSGSDHSYLVVVYVFLR